MSRHSKWSKIKRAKGAADVARAKVFSKLARAITVCAREGGGDPAFNFKLRLAIDRAKADNMPKDAIDRAVVRGSGSGNATALETVLYEGFAPGGAAVLVECLTDNRNRTLADVKQVFTKQGGTLGSEGSVRWQFEQRGVVRAASNAAWKDGETKESFELALIEAGAEDIREEDDQLVIFTAVDVLQRVRDAVEDAGVALMEAGLEWIPQQTVEVMADAREPFELFLEALDDLDDAQEVFTNARGY